MLATTLLTVIALAAGIAPEVEAGLLGSSLRVPRAHSQHKRLSLALHNKRGMPEKRCKLKPSGASTKISNPTSTTSASASNPTGSGGGGGGGSGGGTGKTITGVHSDECPTTGATGMHIIVPREQLHITERFRSVIRRQ